LRLHQASLVSPPSHDGNRSYGVVVTVRVGGICTPAIDVVWTDPAAVAGPVPVEVELVLIVVLPSTEVALLVMLDV
jgi:hypothetical protein